MSIRVKTRQGESVNQLMRRFKKLCEKEGLTKDIKRKQYFEKPSERRRRAARKSLQRLTRTPGLTPRPPRPGRPGAAPTGPQSGSSRPPRGRPSR
jgi:small subunit ribosomal protein S21